MCKLFLAFMVVPLSFVLPTRIFEKLWRKQRQDLVGPFRSGVGRVGLILFLTLVALAVYVLIAYPADFGKKAWNNPEYWADNPKAAAPSWTRLFDGDKAKHQVFESSTAEVISEGSGKLHTYRFLVKNDPGHLPSFVSFSVSSISFGEISPIIEVYLRDADNKVLIHRHIVPEPRLGEASPVFRYQEFPHRVNLTADPETKGTIEEFLVDLGERGQKEFSAEIVVYLTDNEDTVEGIKFVFGGNAYGLLGTDTIGRDVSQGILAGLPIALLIALSTSLIVSVVGASLGGISGYFGGIVDTLIQRIIDVIVSIPALPILIFLTFIFGPKLSNIILILAAFGWTGLAVQLRPWILQIRESGLIEYSRAKGFSSWRIIFRHILPQTLPFIFAYFIFFAPGAILAEAGLSFLGLGDPSVVTWGQMLQQGFGTGAVYLGYWWWIIPPGIAIVITALTLFLLFSALEVIAEPRLRRE